ncbi:hypothetical protein OH76DRAFT_563004 [Lentinus brumalis]|uniref:Uncharacterized protein n=1 Tax=Lentinus brumalis TaxID=2498619 RepID=A0A371DT66_9APHY|nr:hypothetical protein OH76DRAFT_563004 [Polyporus brumalis]
MTYLILPSRYTNKDTVQDNFDSELCYCVVLYIAYYGTGGFGLTRTALNWRSEPARTCEALDERYWRRKRRGRNKPLSETENEGSDAYSSASSDIICAFNLSNRNCD